MKERNLNYHRYKNLSQPADAPIRRPKAFLEEPEQPAWTRFPNELIDRLTYGRVTASEALVVMCLVRQTYGFLHRDAILMSNSELEEMTGMSLSTVKRCLKSLQQKGILFVESPRPGQGYGYTVIAFVYD